MKCYRNISVKSLWLNWMGLLRDVFLEHSVFLTGHLKVSCVARKDKQYFISIGDATNNKKLSFKLD